VIEPRIIGSDRAATHRWFSSFSLICLSSFPFLDSFPYLRQRLRALLNQSYWLASSQHILKALLAMRVSYAFVLHLLSVGMLTTTLLGGFILDRKLRKEPDLRLKLYTAGISRTIGLLSPVAAILLLVTGIANIHNRFLGSTSAWYAEGWLVAKIIVYVVMVLNGMFYGPGLMRSRLKLIRSQAEQSAPTNADTLIRSYNRQLTLFYAVQTLLFLFIVYISVFGTAKHPGVI